VNIVFYAAKSGLGNNGGTRTMLKSAAAMRRYGHRVSVVARIDNFTYFQHPACLPEIPQETDIVIAASHMDIEAMHEAWRGRSAWWMRMWDVHRMPESKIFRLASMQHMFVNGEFMRDKLARAGIGSEIVYQGIDFGDWFPPLVSPCKSRIGILCRHQQHYQYQRFEELFPICCDRHEFTAITHADDLLSWYQSLRFYFAPQTLGGLANPPMEAALCGALIVCPGVLESGLSDYANKDTAIIYERLEDIPALLESADFGKVAAMSEVLINKIGSREKNMQKFLAYLSKIDYN